MKNFNALELLRLVTFLPLIIVLFAIASEDQIGAFQHLHRFAYRLGFVTPAGIAEKRRPGRTVGQAVILAPADLDQKRIDLGYALFLRHGPGLRRRPGIVHKAPHQTQGIRGAVSGLLGAIEPGRS